MPWVTPNAINAWPLRRRRKKKEITGLSKNSVELPNLDKDLDAEIAKDVETSEKSSRQIPAIQETQELAPQTPTTTQGPSEDTESVVSTTPSSTQLSSLPTGGEANPLATKSQRTAVPAVPVVRSIPKSQSKDTTSTTPQKVKEEIPEEPKSTPSVVTNGYDVNEPISQEIKATPPAPKAWATPRAWTGLFGSSGAPSAPSVVGGSQNESSGFGKKNTESLAEALRSFNAGAKASKISFLKPRGLVNTGNMCYMNSVLQVLVFCAPFYDFLEQVSKKAAHSFKNETPLIDAM